MLMEQNLLRLRLLDQKSNPKAVTRGVRQNHTTSLYRPVTHLSKVDKKVDIKPAKHVDEKLETKVDMMAEKVEGNHGTYWAP